MSDPIKHTTDWRFSTVASWLAVTVASLYYSEPQQIPFQLPIHAALCGVLWWIIQSPNQHTVPKSLCYFVLITALFPFTQTSLVLIHLVMFTSLFSVHFKPITVTGVVVVMLAVYSAFKFDAWQGQVPWATLAIWGFWGLATGIMSRRFVQSLNMHYQSRQNVKELQATQSMMTAMSKEQERLAISRELHDSLGHKLTALSINLDFIKRTAPNELQESLNTCHTLSQEILDEVRHIVSAQRQDIGLLKTSLLSIFNATPTLKCSLSLAPELARLDQQQSLCLIRFCQEMINNTLKHSNATEIEFTIALSDIEHKIIATAHHNSPESKLPKAGNGIKGLQERVALLNGTFTQKITNSTLVSELCIPLHLDTAEVA